MTRREVFIQEYVDVECCNHCHGDPEECTARSIPPERWIEASDLLARAEQALYDLTHTGINLSHSARFQTSALRDDLRYFLRTAERQKASV